MDVITGTQVGDYAPDFELPGVDGSVHHLRRYLDTHQAVGVIIMCNHCPYVQASIDLLKAIQHEFQSQNVTLVGINGNDDQQYPEDSLEQMKLFSAQHQLNFPYLRDNTQDVTHGFGATCTPEAYLIDTTGIVQYRGAIANSSQIDLASQIYLKEAIAQLLAHQPINPSSMPATGCSVKWRNVVH
jgi:peroxiredoxin